MRALATFALMAALAAAAPSIPAFDRGWSSDGALVASELRCTACHAGPDSAPPGPALAGVVERFDPAYLRAFLLDPQRAAPGGAMPRLRMTAQDADAIAVWLASPQGPEPVRPLAGSPDRGKMLFHRVGCVQCHGETPLANLDRRHTHRSLTAFLLDPIASRPAARMPRTPLSPQEAADLASYLIPRPRPDAPRVPADSAKARLGRAAYQRLGCGSCHGGTKFAAKPFAGLDRAKDCTQADYGLSPALRQALAARGAPSPQSQLAALGCPACHVRGKAGPDPARDRFFELRQDTDLGDEGRLPPRLDGVGAKLTREALSAAIQGKIAVRPQIATRMPGYGPAQAAKLAAWFEQADARATAHVERVGRNGFGRELVGSTGLGCVVCHNLNGRKSSGIGASDLTEAPKRLRVEWFRDLLIDPARFHPGTRMPSFWPGGKASNRKILGGNADRQIDSIWVYLMEIDQSRLPAGMEDKGRFELKPEGRAIVLRTFLDAAGTHGVAVGYPENVHASFDALEVRWAQAWRGAFLDAENTWDNRFNPPTRPLGSDVIDLPLPAAVTGADGPVTCRFGGYRLDRKGTPTFDYDCGGVQLEDRLEPAGDGPLRRTVKVTGARDGLLFRAGVKHGRASIEPIGFAVRERESGGALELVAPLSNREYVEVVRW